MSSFYCDICGTLCEDTIAGYVSGCEHCPVGPPGHRKIAVRRCSLASCVGGIDGCNGSECKDAYWDRMSRDEYMRYMGREALLENQ